MTTTKTLKVNQNFDRLLKCRANGYYDYVDVVIPTKNNKDINVEMQEYDGLKYTIDRQSGAGTTIIDFSDTVLPWKFEMNNYLARTRYCLKSYSETPYQVEILEPKYNNISIVGSPTINDNIVSGFSSSNYLTLNNSLVSKNNATYVFKVTLPTSITSNQCVFEQSYFANLEFRSATQDFRAFNWGASQYAYIMAPELGKTYWFKINVNGDVKTYSYSEDGIDYTTAYTMNDNGTNTTTGNFYIGETSRLGNIFQGSIDLSECYIEANDSKFNLSDTTYVKQWNLNKVGDVQVSDDGVISNFSSSNYVSISNVHINTEEELLLVFRTSDDFSGDQTVFRSSANALELYIKSNGRMGIWNNSQSEEVFLTNAAPNTEYYVRFRFLEDKNIEVGLSLNGSNYEWQSFRDTVLVYTDTAEYDIGRHTLNNAGYFRGTFDYNKSNIPQTGGKLKTEELYGIIDGADFSILEPIYCYANRDERVLLRNTKTEKMDVTDWYLGEFKFFDVDIELQPDLDV